MRADLNKLIPELGICNVLKIVVWVFCLMQLCASTAFAFSITDSMEQFTVASVGTGWTSVTFANNYTTPIPVCVGTNASSANWTPVVRLRDVVGGASGGMSIRVQKLASVENDTSSPTVYVGPVHCIIAEAGVHSLPGAGAGVWFQAGKQSVTNTYGSNGAVNGWTGFTADAVSVNTGLDGAYAGSGLSSTLGVVAQIMTYNDPRGQVVHVNDCEGRANLPFQSGFSDGVCIGRHISQLALISGAPNSRLGEDIGYIIFRTGAGAFDYTFNAGAANESTSTFNFSGGLSPDDVQSVSDSPPYSYSTTYTLQGAVATQQAEDGGNGSYVGLYGTSPLSGGFIDLALDEGVTSDRRHTDEYVAWLGFRSVTIPIEVEKVVDISETDDFETLSYTMTLTNSGDAALSASQIVVSDALVQGATGPTVAVTVTPAATNGTSLAAGASWTYTATYDITESNFDDWGAGDLVNTFTATASEGTVATTRTASATTLISLDPKLSVIKTSALLGGGSIPAGGAAVGDVIEYTYTVRNDGNVSMSPVNFSDDHYGLGDPLDFGSCTISQDLQTLNNTVLGSTDFQVQTLAPRDTVVCTATYTVVQADIENLQ